MVSARVLKTEGAQLLALLADPVAVQARLAQLVEAANHASTLIQEHQGLAAANTLRSQHLDEREAQLKQVEDDLQDRENRIVARENAAAEREAAYEARMKRLRELAA